MNNPTILAIDTSCDETAAAVSCGRRILSNVISSQINIHKKWGGVVPHLAKRAHIEKIKPVVKEALTRFGTPRVSFEPAPGSELQSLVGSELPAACSPDKNRDERQFGTLVGKTDAIAVTIGPGLAPALEVGLAYAKKLALKHNKPLIPINHMEGHLLSPLALNSKGQGPLALGSELRRSSEPPIFPAIGLLVSGGHTQLVLVKKIGDYQLLGETLDDAAGEALDKLAKMLKLGYPGGPIIEELAKKGDPNAIELPVPIRYSKDFNFSFSGLKTAALYKIRDQGSELRVSSEPSVSKQYTYNMCAAFQKSIAVSLTTKLTRAIKKHNPKSILLGGGVISNLYIRSQIRSAVRPFNLPVYLPYSKKLFTDNAAMICIPAYYKFNKDPTFVKNLDKLDRQPNLGF